MLLAMALKHSRKIGEIFAVRLAESDGFGDAIALTLEIRLVHVTQIDEIHRGTSHNDQRLKIVHANDVAKVIKIACIPHDAELGDADGNAAVIGRISSCN